MKSSTLRDSLSRREFLRATLFSAAGATLLPTIAFTQANPNPSLYTFFRIGLYSYSLRDYSLDEALAKTQSLGLRWWEGHPKHIPVTEDAKAIADYKDKLKAHSVQMPTWGVLDFTNDEADARRKFAFAKAMGVETITASPSKEALSLLDKLADQYGINVGIVNKGADDEAYGKWEKVLAAIEGHNARLGACEDTANYLRAGDVPETAASKFGKRLYGLHLTNVHDTGNGQKEVAEIGLPGGLLDTVGLFKTLHAIPYHGVIAIASQQSSGDPMPYLKNAVDTLHRFFDSRPA